MDTRELRAKTQDSQQIHTKKTQSKINKTRSNVMNIKVKAKENEIHEKEPQIGKIHT